METLSIEEERMPAGNVCLRVGGSLDRSAAYELRDRILGLGTQELVLDFSKIGHADDVALSVLAMWLADRNQSKLKVQLVGLDHHARRILQVFGVDTEVGLGVNQAI
ncbi:lipid asymmetry maintenance protein MlaB [Vulgatibacter sp.]|uniref:STAS domain-containing protein n=1 Tax=Vulgatibacter sp. TaxID=1971226 RepID=UPI0035688C59